MLRDERRRLADFLGNVALLLALRQLAADEIGNLAGRQLVALQILDNLVGFVVVVIHKSRDGFLLGQLRGAIAPRPVVDDVPAIGLGMFPHRDRRFNATVADRHGQLAKAFRREAGVIGLARLVRVLVDQMQGQLQGAGAAVVSGRWIVQEARKVAQAIEAQASALRLVCGLAGRFGGGLCAH